MNEVFIIQRRLTNYRLPLFNILHRLLADAGIRLRLVYGDATSSELLKSDDATLSWAEHLNCNYLLGNRICWQNFGSLVANADLVIVTQENALLYNLLALTIKRPKRIAFWGHGCNMQSTNSMGIKESFKRLTTRMVDWWFAYTEISRNLIVETGFPTEKVTVLNNATDTTDLKQHLIEIKSGYNYKTKIMNDLGIKDGPVGVFVGSLYAEKRLDFIVESVAEIRKCHPDFTLLIVGEGPDGPRLKARAGLEPWIRVLGAFHGKEKMQVLSIADVMLLPGAVGLGILDSFVSGVPLVTTNCRNHGPEIGYLRNFQNGHMTNNSIEEYVAGVHKLLSDKLYYNSLVEGCRMASSYYTVETMAQNFANGIIKAIRN